MSSEFLATRVNSARLPHYIGKTVRVIGKTLSVSQDVVVVQASDGGHIVVQLPKEEKITDPFIEVVGSVVNGTTIKMRTFVELGSDLDLKLVDDTIQLIHDPRFYSKMFT